MLSFAVWAYVDSLDPSLLPGVPLRLGLPTPFLGFDVEVRVSVICVPFVPFAFPSVYLVPVHVLQLSRHSLATECTFHVPDTQMHSTPELS